MQVRDEGIGEPILLGRPERIRSRHRQPRTELRAQLLSITTKPITWMSMAICSMNCAIARVSPWAKPARWRGSAIIMPRSWFSKGDADAMVSGLAYEYPDVIRPALQVFGTRAGATRAAGVYLMIVDGRTYLFSDATVNIDPDAETLAEIAVLANDFAVTLGLGSARRHAVLLQLRLDAASAQRQGRAAPCRSFASAAPISLSMARCKPIPPSWSTSSRSVIPSAASAMPMCWSSPIWTRPISRTSFSRRLTEAEAIGPILLGMGAPVHVLQAGDDVEDIVAIAAVAAMDAHTRGGLGRNPQRLL